MKRGYGVYINARGRSNYVVKMYFFFFFPIVGTVDKGFVEVTNCFCVPHKEYEDQVSTCLYAEYVGCHFNDVTVNWFCVNNCGAYTVP